MRPDLLDVVAVIANPIRWRSRVKLFNDFVAHMRESGVRLTLVECAYGERPWQIADVPGATMVRVRAKTLVWNKENLINIGLGRLRHGWKYVAWIDADIRFRDPDWASETVHALQQYAVIQPWAHCYDLGPNGEHLELHTSFMRQYWHGQLTAADSKVYAFAHPGFAWAATRAAIDGVGGLIDTAAAGAGDHHMALGLIGKAHWSIRGDLSANYAHPILQWQARARKHIDHNVGFLPGTIEHLFHGAKASRRYTERWGMLRQHGFDPYVDLKRNAFGVIELAGNKPGLAHDMDRYFRGRDEDGNAA